MQSTSHTNTVVSLSELNRMPINPRGVEATASCSGLNSSLFLEIYLRFLTHLCNEPRGLISIGLVVRDVRGLLYERPVKYAHDRSLRALNLKWGFFYFWCLVLCITAIYFSSYIDQIVINIKLYFSYCSYSLIFSAHCKCVWLIVKLNNDDNWIFRKMLTQKFGKLEFIYINLIPRKIAKGKLYNPSDWQLSQLHRYRDGLTQDCSRPIDNALESPQPCAIDLYLGVIARKSR